MSGGSFNYLYMQELCLYTDVVQEMADNLDARCSRCGGMTGDATWPSCKCEGPDTSTAMKDAAAATRTIVALMHEIGRRRAALADVWHAVEWNQSGDTFPADVAQAVAKWAAGAQTHDETEEPHP